MEMGKSMKMERMETLHSPFPTESKLSLGDVRENLTILDISYLYFQLDFQLFSCQKVSIRFEFTGNLFHDAHEKQQQVR